MFTELVLLAEEATYHGPNPAVIGIGAFIILMALLVITFLFSGMHTKPSSSQQQAVEVKAEAKSRQH